MACFILSFRQLLFLESMWITRYYLVMPAMYTWKLLIAKIAAFSCALSYLQLTTIKIFFFLYQYSEKSCSHNAVNGKIQNVQTVCFATFILSISINFNLFFFNMVKCSFFIALGLNTCTVYDALILHDYHVGAK